MMIARTILRRVTTTSHRTLASSAGQQRSHLADIWPHADAVRYEWKNVKMTYREVNVSRILVYVCMCITYMCIYIYELICVFERSSSDIDTQ